MSVFIEEEQSGGFATPIVARNHADYDKPFLIRFALKLSFIKNEKQAGIALTIFAILCLFVGGYILWHYEIPHAHPVTVSKFIRPSIRAAIPETILRQVKK